MKTVNRQFFILTGLALAILITMFSDFLALHDIADDYVCQKIPETYAIKEASTLPAWTHASLEWQWIEFMYISRLVLIGLFGYFAYRFNRETPD